MAARPRSKSISWSLSGAFLSIPPLPSGKAFYVADSTNGLLLPVTNAGNEPVGVNFTASGALNVTPNPLNVFVGVTGQAQLGANSSAPACASQTTANATLKFNYSCAGSSCSVCQPLPPSISVLACTGSYPQ
jgi:hypothetical protein